jgi:hypothetical protein
LLPGSNLALFLSDEEILMKLRFATLPACLCLLASLTWADTLELKNGSVIKGVYMGGTQNEISFQVGSTLQKYSLSDVESLKIDADGANAPAAGTPEVPPAPATAQPAPTASEPSSSEPSSSNEGFGTRPVPADGSPGRLYVPDNQTPENNSRETRPLTVPSGTHITVRTMDSIDSDKNQTGDKFRATLEQPISVNDVLVAPKGTLVYGRITEVKSAGPYAGRSQVRLALTGLVLNGHTYSLATGDHESAGRSRGADTAAKVGGGAVLGAIIGGVIGGGKGAAVGATVGAGAGTAAQGASRGPQVHLPSETLLEFTLEQPVTMQVASR